MMIILEFKSKYVWPKIAQAEQTHYSCALSDTFLITVQKNCSKRQKEGLLHSNYDLIYRYFKISALLIMIVPFLAKILQKLCRFLRRTVSTT